MEQFLSKVFEASSRIELCSSLTRTASETISLILVLGAAISLATPFEALCQVNITRQAAMTDHFLPSQVSSVASNKLDILGNRWKRPGQERLSYTLSLKVKEKGQDLNEQALLTAELPNRVTLERPGNRKIGHDGEESWRSGAALPDDDDIALLETLGFDCVENFFEALRSGAAMQFAGSRFRLSAPSTSAYDIYIVSVPVKLGKQSQFVNKTYFFNSDTGLLELVRYQGARGIGVKGQVETRFAWQKRGQDFVLKSFQRIEGGQVVADGTVDTVQISAKAADGKFRP